MAWLIAELSQAAQRRGGTSCRLLTGCTLVRNDYVRSPAPGECNGSQGSTLSPAQDRSIQEPSSCAVSETGAMKNRPSLALTAVAVNTRPSPSVEVFMSESRYINSKGDGDGL